MGRSMSEAGEIERRYNAARPGGDKMPTRKPTAAERLSVHTANLVECCQEAIAEALIQHTVRFPLAVRIASIGMDNPALAIPALELLLDDPSPSVRRAAAIGLERIELNRRKAEQEI
jgi:HEAT repeat protein